MDPYLAVRAIFSLEDGLHFPPFLSFHSLNEAGLPIVISPWPTPIFSFLKFLIKKHLQQIVKCGEALQISRDGKC